MKWSPAPLLIALIASVKVGRYPPGYIYAYLALPAFARDIVGSTDMFADETLQT